MSEMNHVKVAENLERLANDFEEVGSPGNAKILRSAAADERRIANGELVPVVHAYWINSYSPHNHRCSECDAEFTNVRERYCPNCGAVMDESRDGNSLNGKDDTK